MPSSETKQNGRAHLITADEEKKKVIDSKRQSERMDLLKMLDAMDTNDIFDEIVEYRKDYKQFPKKASGIFVCQDSHIWDPTIVHDNSSWDKLFAAKQ